jgi:hypothetical protein
MTTGLLRLSDIEGKLEGWEPRCSICSRKGPCNVAHQIAKLGRDTPLDDITRPHYADGPNPHHVDIYQRCRAETPGLAKIVYGEDYKPSKRGARETARKAWGDR